MDAISKEKGPCVVFAGAGTGKTYTIVEKVKYLVENKVYDADKIVCLTFSNEAAKNLLVRVRKALGLGEGDKEPVIRTFHGFSADLLKEHNGKDSFKILDPDEAKVVLHRNLRIIPGLCHQYVSAIGIAKDLDISIDKVREYVDRKIKSSGLVDVDLDKRIGSLEFELHTLHLKKDRWAKRQLLSDLQSVKQIAGLRKFIFAWQAYEKLKDKRGYQDYADLNMRALELLKNNKSIAEKFNYIIVDEFQDTNKVQLDFLFELAKGVTMVGPRGASSPGPLTSIGMKGITVVGDLNQSIYRFRGAYQNNIKEFREHFNVQEGDVFNLDKSFRSPNSVLRIAHKLICNNYSEKDAKDAKVLGRSQVQERASARSSEGLVSESCFLVENIHEREGDKVKVFEMKNGKEEARKIVELVEERLEKGDDLNDICVLFRTHQQGRMIKKALEGKEVKYCSVTKDSLFKQPSIRKAVNYLKILDKVVREDKGGEDAWWDLIYLSGIGEKDLIQIGRFIREKVGGGDAAGRNPADPSAEGSNEGGEIIGNVLLNELDKLPLSPSGRLSCKMLVDRVKMLLSKVGELEMGELVKEVYRVGGLVGHDDEESREKQEVMLNLNKFYELAKSHAELYDNSLSGFLYYLDILDKLGIDVGAGEIEEEGVRLMTLHATKGLEFKTVIVSNMAQKRFPIVRYGQSGLLPLELLPDLSDNGGSIDDLEKKFQLLEERRLCYVAFTRAKENLILTFANDYGGRRFHPSQFLEEIGFRSGGDAKANTLDIPKSQNKPQGLCDVEYLKDVDEKWEEPIVVGSRFGMESVLKSGNFDEILIKAMQEADSATGGEVRELDKTSYERKTFSPSSLLLFNECEKKFEYKYVYNMPEPVSGLQWEAMRLGSFIHLVLEIGVRAGFRDVVEFKEFARELSLDEDWEGVDLEAALKMVDVFFARNARKFDGKSKTEQRLHLDIGGLKFMGFADRIDFADNGLEIIDYKTGKSQVMPKHRDWQLGYYALAASKLGKVRKVTLEMLRQEKPLEFVIDEQGNATCSVEGSRMSFNIYKVEEELAECAGRVKMAYEKGFKPCGVEKNCEFCNEYVYGD